jgi:hypothetical protein
MKNRKSEDSFIRANKYIQYLDNDKKSLNMHQELLVIYKIRWFYMA